jgi:hypothetical protein
MMPDKVETVPLRLKALFEVFVPCAWAVGEKLPPGLAKPV